LKFNGMNFAVKNITLTCKSEMKNIVILLPVLISSLFLSCEKNYKEEIFIDKYTKIYGQWRFDHYDGMFIPATIDEYYIEFIPFGKFSYNGEKPGNIKIVEQTEKSLQIDFNDLFPHTGISGIGFRGPDTLSIFPLGADVTGKIFIRIKK
jgi:hypothetical protein